MIHIWVVRLGRTNIWSLTRQTECRLNQMQKLKYDTGRKEVSAFLKGREQNKNKKYTCCIVDIIFQYTCTNLIRPAVYNVEFNYYRSGSAGQICTQIPHS